MSELYSRIGIDFDQLGCIMLDIACGCTCHGKDQQ